MTTEQFLICLAETESNNNPNAPLGDNGRALGRFQTHPDWIHTYARLFILEPRLNETWDSFITRIVTAFYNYYVRYLTELEVAMFFHLGHQTLPTNADWDENYAQRFQSFAANFTR